MTATPASQLRPRHVISAYAAGAAAGLWANAVAVLGLIPIFAIAGSPVRPAGLDSVERATASAMGAVLVGLLYASGAGWLPRPMLARSAAFALIGAPIMAGVHATALSQSSADVERALPWTVVAAVATAALTPVVLRAILVALVGSFQSVAAVPPIKSLILIGLVLVVLLYRPAVAVDVAANAPLGIGALVALIAALGVGAWTIGRKSPGERPSWFGAFGLIGLGLSMLAGLVTMFGATAR